MSTFTQALANIIHQHMPNHAQNVAAPLVNDVRCNATCDMCLPCALLLCFCIPLALYTSTESIVLALQTVPALQTPLPHMVPDPWGSRSRFPCQMLAVADNACEYINIYAYIHVHTEKLAFNDTGSCQITPSICTIICRAAL